MILPAIRKRRAVRSYTAEAISPAQIKELLTAAFFAPTSRNRRATEFIVVTDKPTRVAIHDALVPQSFVKEAPVIIIPAVDTKISDKPEADLTLASENILLQATEMGLGSIWKHVHEVSELEKIRTILGVPEHFLIINIIPIGKTEEVPPPHADSEVDAKRIHREKW